MNRPVLPGATLGVLGGGQLGRMFALAARQMGYRVHILAPESDPPTAQVADLHIQADYLDRHAGERFARNVAVVTYEFENIPIDALHEVEKFAPVRPGAHVLHVTQHRLREKNTLAQAGFPVTPYRPVRSLDELKTALTELGVPAVLKTASWGYDGKGQAPINRLEEAEHAWRRVGADEAVCEAWIAFTGELSVVAARSMTGAVVTYGPFANIHRNHILDLSVFPANLEPTVRQAACRLAEEVADALKVVGVVCVEYFLLPDGNLLINELAPRPHNSGHLTLDAHLTSQFEQQVRAVCGLPLGSAAPRGAAAMANLLGDLWRDGPPRWEQALKEPGVKLHLYGKVHPRPGRKMGHLTALADTPEAALNIVQQARLRLSNPVSSTPTDAF